MLRFHFLVVGYFVVQMINPGLLDPSHDSAVTPAIMQSYFLCQFKIASRNQVQMPWIGLSGPHQSGLNLPFSLVFSTPEFSL